jgi:hypothetical protein
MSTWGSKLSGRVSQLFTAYANFVLVKGYALERETLKPKQQ